MASPIEDNSVAKAVWETLSDTDALDAGTKSALQGVLGLGNASLLNVDADLATFSLPANTTISTFGKTLVGSTDAATARTNLGLGTAATANTGDFAAALGADENYVTDAEKTILANTSGTNTGDQDLSGYLPLSGGTMTGGLSLSNGSGASYLLGSSSYYNNGSSAIFYSGSIATFQNGTIKLQDTTYQTSLNFTDPTEDRTINFPDASGTVALTSDIPSTAVTLSGDQTVAGVKTFTSPIKSSGALTGDATEVPNLSQSDARYGITVAIAADVVTAPNSATLTDIAGLIIANIQPGNYIFESYLAVSSSTYATTGSQGRLFFGGTVSAIRRDVEYYSTAGEEIINGNGTLDTGKGQYTTLAYPGRSLVIVERGVMTVTVAGDLTLQMAQQTAGAGNLTARAGAYIRLTKV